MATQSKRLDFMRWRLLTWCLVGGLGGKIVISTIFLNPGGIINLWSLSESHAAATQNLTVSSTPPLPRLLALVKEERRALQSKNETLQEREAQLLTLKQELEKRLRELANIQNRVNRLLEEERKIQDDRQRHLIVTLESMPPERAGELIGKMDEDLVVRLLRRMKGKEAGKILGLLEAEKAARISKSLFD